MKNLLLMFALILLFPALTVAQGNAFNFQGRLNDGTSPANGRYDLQFKLFDAATGGTQIGPTATRPNTVLINGVFSVNLDFGTAAFQNPDAVFIEIAVKPAGSTNAYTILGPRQQLTVVPFASRAQNATNAVNAQNAVNSQNADNATTANNALSLGGLGSSSYALKSDTANFIRNSTTTQANTNFNISGAGVINGNLSVGGNQSLVGNLTVGGAQTLGGDTIQSRDKSGLIKALAYVNGNSTIIRCYNGVTGSSTGNCGFAVTRYFQGSYAIDFGFRVDDRFISMTPYTSGSVNIVANFYLGGTGSNFVGVTTNITDVDYNQSFADNNFMIIVY